MSLAVSPCPHFVLLCVYRAEVLAAEIRELQGEMADYNTVRLGSVERCLFELHS